MATKTDSLDPIWRTPDALWDLIAPILGPDKPPGTVGRPSTPNRVLFDAIIFVLRSGCQWQAIPRGTYAPRIDRAWSVPTLGSTRRVGPRLANLAALL